MHKRRMGTSGQPPPPPPHQQHQQQESFVLSWNDFHGNLAESLQLQRHDSDFFDVTLACDDDQQLRAHRFVLAASSGYFASLLKRNAGANNPILIMPPEVKFGELRSLVDFMYRGEVSVQKEDIQPFLKLAEMLRVKGLMSEDADKSASSTSSVSAGMQSPMHPTSHVQQQQQQKYHKMPAGINVRRRTAGAAGAPPMEQQQAGYPGNMLPLPPAQKKARLGKNAAQQPQHATPAPGSSQSQQQQLMSPSSVAAVKRYPGEEEAVNDEDDIHELTPMDAEDPSALSTAAAAAGGGYLEEYDPAMAAVAGYSSSGSDSYAPPPHAMMVSQEMGQGAVPPPPPPAPPISNPARSSTSAPGGSGTRLVALQCPECPRQLPGVEAFRGHMATVHGKGEAVGGGGNAAGGAAPAPGADPNPNATLMPPVEERVVCNICDKVMKSAKTLIAHQKRLHKISTPQTPPRKAGQGRGLGMASPRGRGRAKASSSAEKKDRGKPGRPRKNVELPEQQQPQQQHQIQHQMVMPNEDFDAQGNPGMMKPLQQQQQSSPHPQEMSRPIGQVQPAPRQGSNPPMIKSEPDEVGPEQSVDSPMSSGAVAAGVGAGASATGPVGGPGPAATQQRSHSRGSDDLNRPPTAGHSGSGAAPPSSSGPSTPNSVASTTSGPRGPQRMARPSQQQQQQQQQQQLQQQQSQQQHISGESPARRGRPPNQARGDMSLKRLGMKLGGQISITSSEPSHGQRRLGDIHGVSITKMKGDMPIGTPLSIKDATGRHPNSAAAAGPSAGGSGPVGTATPPSTSRSSGQAPSQQQQQQQQQQQPDAVVVKEEPDDDDAYLDDEAEEDLGPDDFDEEQYMEDFGHHDDQVADGVAYPDNVAGSVDGMYADEDEANFDDVDEMGEEEEEEPYESDQFDELQEEEDDDEAGYPHPGEDLAQHSKT